MGIFAIFLVVGPVLALLYFPLTNQELPFLGRSKADKPTSGGPSPAAFKGIDAMRWVRSAEEHLRCLKDAA